MGQNAKKILFDQQTGDIAKSLNEVNGISSVFVGPGFLTITKENNFEWEAITEEILNIFDRL